jgi:CBS domain-containing protein
MIGTELGRMPLGRPARSTPDELHDPTSCLPGWRKGGTAAMIPTMNVSPPSSILVADAMRPGILTCDPETTLREVARLMATRRVHCVLVRGVDPPAPARFAVLSDLDLARATGDGAVENITARDVAWSPVITVAPDATLQHAAGLMARHTSTHLVVTERDTRTPVGVLSTLDVAAALAGIQSPGLAPAVASKSSGAGDATT